MSNRLFESFKRPATRTEIAMQITLDTIAEHQQARKGREDQPWDAADTDRMERLAALMTGPHQAAVTPIVLKAYPQMAMLIDRKVGIVTAPHVITDVQGTEHTYADAPLEHGAKVTFRVADDGLIAFDVTVLEPAPTPAPQGTA